MMDHDKGKRAGIVIMNMLPQGYPQRKRPDGNISKQHCPIAAQLYSR